MRASGRCCWKRRRTQIESSFGKNVPTTDQCSHRIDIVHRIRTCSRAKTLRQSKSPSTNFCNKICHGCCKLGHRVWWPFFAADPRWRLSNPVLPKINLPATAQQQSLPIYRSINQNCATSRPKDRFVHAQRILLKMRAKAAALPKLRSNHATRSNNVAIWRPSRPLYV
jgi:hypothetical protein